MRVLIQAGEAAFAEVKEAVAEGFRDFFRRLGGQGEQGVPTRGDGEHGEFGCDLIDCVAFDVDVAVGAVGAAGSGPQQAEEVVEFGGGGYGRTRIARRVFLSNGDGWSDAVDLFYVGLFHALQELARVGGERFDVAALAFGVDGVER